MPGLIVIGGAPGTGKSKLASGLREVLRGPWIDFGCLREFHLERDWSNAGPAEEAMTFENLVSIIRNYFHHGYANIIVDDLQDHRIQRLPMLLPELPVHVLTLFVSDPSELRRRIISRNDGWKDAEAAIAWNRRVIDRACVDREQKIDVTSKSPSAVRDEALEVLGVSRTAIAAADGVPA